MSLEPPKESFKTQNLTWWIASIATSVLCCSILFVLFGGYIVEVKNSLGEARESIRTIQENEDRILDELQMIRRGLLLKTNKGPQDVNTENGAVVDGVPDVAVPVVPNATINETPEATAPTALVPAPAETKAPAAQPTTAAPGAAPTAPEAAAADKTPAAKK